MAKKIKYPEIPMRDSVVDRLKQSATPEKGITEVSSETISINKQNRKGDSTKSKGTFKSIGTVSNDDGSKAINYTTQKRNGTKTKSSSYYLQMKEGEDSKLSMRKGSRTRNFEGTRAERKVDRVFNRGNKQ
jgi:hypothetical protein